MEDNERYDLLKHDYDNLKKRFNRVVEETEYETRKKDMDIVFRCYQDLKNGLRSGDSGIRLIFNKVRKSIEDNDITIIDERYIRMRNCMFSDDYAEAVASDNFAFVIADGATRISKLIEDGFIDNKTGKVMKYAKVSVVI